MNVTMKLMSPVRCYEAVSAKANLRKQVKRSGRSQNPIQQKGIGFDCAVSAKANSCSDVKRSGRSQNRRLQKGLPV